MILSVKKRVQNERQLCTVPTHSDKTPTQHTVLIPSFQHGRLFAAGTFRVSQLGREPDCFPVSSHRPASQRRYPYALLLPRAAKLQLSSSPAPLDGTGCPGTSVPRPLPSPAPPGQFDRKAPAVMDLR